MAHISDLKAKRLQKKLRKRFETLGWNVHINGEGAPEIAPFTFILADTRIQDFMSIQPRLDTWKEVQDRAQAIEIELIPATPYDLLINLLSDVSSFESLTDRKRELLATTTLVVALSTKTFKSLRSTSDEGAIVVVVYEDVDSKGAWIRYGGTNTKFPSFEEIKNIVTSVLDFARQRTPEHFGLGQVIKFEPRRR